MEASTKEIAPLNTLPPVFEGENAFIGELEICGQTVEVYAFQQTEEASLGISRWVEWAALSSLPQGDCSPLLEHQFICLSAFRSLLHDIHSLIQKLNVKAERIELPQVASASLKSEHLPLVPPKSVHTTPSQSEQASVHPRVYSSLFSLAKELGSSTNKRLHEVQREKRSDGVIQPTSQSRIPQKAHLECEQKDKRERGGDQERNQSGQNQEEQQKKKPFSFFQSKKRKSSSASISRGEAQTKVFTYNANLSPKEKSSTTQAVISDIGNIYILFMSLMSRILGQAEAEGQELYKKIKARTDQVDVLIRLQSKINNSKDGIIDWTKDEEGQALLKAAREMGVEIPEEKLKWKKEEVHLLKENIAMRKDSMEKLTQLERTDMQRFLQEASQCHQARSNILKLMKEVGDTIIHNMRP